MTPKEKAKNLFDKMFSSGRSIEVEQSKKCALVAVDEIVKAMDDVMFPNPFKQYWNEVKQEIEKL